MSGIDACRALKEHPETRDIPVLMVSSKSGRDQMQAALLAGCVDYMFKPIVASELRAKVRMVLREDE